jgi:hypothetical protein
LIKIARAPASIAASTASVISCGSSRQMTLLSTEWPSALSSSRIVAPLTSSELVRLSLAVMTAQLTEPEMSEWW